MGNGTKIRDAREIIAAFGGLTPMARILGLLTGHPVRTTTIQYWHGQNRFPPGRGEEVVRAAKKFAIPLSREERAYLRDPRNGRAPRAPGATAQRSYTQAG